MEILNSDIILNLLKYGYNSVFVAILFTIIVHRDRVADPISIKYFKALAYLLLTIIMLSGIDIYCIYSSLSRLREAHILAVYLRYLLAPFTSLLFTLIYFRGANAKIKRLFFIPSIISAVLCSIILFIKPISFIVEDNANIFSHVELIPLLISFIHCVGLMVIVSCKATLTPNKTLEKLFLNLFLFSIILSGFLKFIYSSHFTLWTTITICSMSYFLVLTIEHLLFDNLTKTYTRSVFEKDIAKIKPKHEFTVTLIDVNDLKKTNDELGHNYGDLAIKAITTEIYKNINIRDRFYRYGGDEFILLSNTETPQSINDKLNIALESCKAMEAFPVSFAHATVIHNANEDMLITIQTVDDLMYERKKAMKVGRI